MFVLSVFVSEGHTEGVSGGRTPLSVLPALGLAHLLCHLRTHGPVCAGQRGGGRSDETSGGEQQGAVYGTTKFTVNMTVNTLTMGCLCVCVCRKPKRTQRWTQRSP